MTDTGAFVNVKRESYSESRYLQLEIEKVDDTFSKTWLHGTIGEEDARPEGGYYTFLAAQNLQKYWRVCHLITQEGAGMACSRHVFQ